jgi:hypothetical protein
MFCPVFDLKKITIYIPLGLHKGHASYLKKWRFKGEVLWTSRNGVERRSAVDPNPAFHVNADPDPDPGFDRQKLKKKKYRLKKKSNRVYFANNIAYTRSGRRQMQLPIRIQGFDDQN